MARRLVVASLFAAIVVSCTGARPRSSTASTVVVPRSREVVVLLVVDQLAGWIAEARLPLLPEEGGFARLIRGSGGLRFLDHGHAVTDTAPGHAALFTGRLPSSHGIGANDTIDEVGRSASILFDESTRLLTPTGSGDRAGSSLAVLRGDTVADRLRARRPDARIVSMSLKDRGSLFGGGRRPDAALYFDPQRNTFVTTTAVATSFPSWAAAVVGDLPQRQREPWTMLDEDFVRSHATVPDDAPGEGDLAGFGTTFPHRFESSSRPGNAFRASPFGDVALVDLALAATAWFPEDDTPVLLSVSFSANDYVGHVFGPSSYEAWDELRRLDVQLARLLDGLDARFGEGRYSVVLSADHGVFEMPEEDVAHAPWCPGPDRYERPCSRSYRLDALAVGRALERAVDEELGDGSWIAGVSDPYVRFTVEALALDAPRRERMVRRIIAAVRATPGFVDALDTTDPGSCRAVRHPSPELFCAAMVPTLGSIYLVPAAGAFYDSTYVPGFGSGHGSPMLYDRRVPFLASLARDAPSPSTMLGGPGTVVRFDTYFALADRLLGGDGAP